MERQREKSTSVHLVWQLFAISAAAAIGLCFVRLIATGSGYYNFLVWNLFLAWLPVVCVAVLSTNLRRQRWLHWQNVLLTGLVVLLLPNSFYIISDLIHLQSTGEINILFDALLFMSFIVSGLLAGLITVEWLRRLLAQRRPVAYVRGAVYVLMLVISFAIYLGRSLRWNSWDVVLHPIGLVFDITDRLIHPSAYPEAVLTTLTFFIVLVTLYELMQRVIALVKMPVPKDR